MERLKVLRMKIKRIDQKILCLLQKRMLLSSAIGREKKKIGIALQDWSVEKSVIENGIRYAEDIGLDVNFARTLITKIIEQSRIQQERLHYSGYSGKREDVLIVGGLGGMGRWFAYFLQNQGHRVAINDIKRTGLCGFSYYKDIKSALKGKSLVLISTPLTIVPGIIETLTGLNCNAVVCDIASVKSHIIPAIKKAIEKNIKITSIHPMFGPSCRTLSDKVVCLCDCGSPQANDMITHIFKNTATRIINLSFDEHDRLVSYVLGLSHFINILFIKNLMDSGYAFKDLKKIASTTFNAQMETANSVIKENPELYFEIQSLNPYNLDLYKDLKICLDVLMEIVKKGKRDAFKEVFQKGCRWLDEY
uniref:Prephenate dehydrogenase/arogenate dehydrogenase family protein n=1 Tax=candidate division WOR-3 bacterium TaxID=2052148 RepID=A0A7C6AGQ0_UNCW3